MRVRSRTNASRAASSANALNSTVSPSAVHEETAAGIGDLIFVAESTYGTRSSGAASLHSAGNTLLTAPASCRSSSPAARSHSSSTRLVGAVVVVRASPSVFEGPLEHAVNAVNAGNASNASSAPRYERTGAMRHTFRRRPAARPSPAPINVSAAIVNGHGSLPVVGNAPLPASTVTLPPPVPVDSIVTFVGSVVVDVVEPALATVVDVVESSGSVVVVLDCVVVVGGTVVVVVVDVVVVDGFVVLVVEVDVDVVGVVAVVVVVDDDVLVVEVDVDVVV